MKVERSSRRGRSCSVAEAMAQIAKRATEASVTRAPSSKPQRKEEVRMAKKKNRKKALWTPSVSSTISAYQQMSSQWITRLCESGASSSE